MKKDLSKFSKKTKWDCLNKSTLKSSSNDRTSTVPWFKNKSIKNRTPPIDEDVDEDHYKDFERLGAKEVDYEWIIKGKLWML